LVKSESKKTIESDGMVRSFPSGVPIVSLSIVLWIKILFSFFNYLYLSRLKKT